jgi:lysophospholipase L1-like esterase
MATFLRRSVTKVWEFMHAFWLIVGVTIAMLLLMETCFRVRSAVNSSRAAARPRTMLAGDPRAAAWYPQFSKEFDDTRVQHWKPYLYFARLPSYRGKYITIDSLAHRVTPQPTTPAIPAARVFFFGGSTMWGNSQRDDHTIAAEAARRLQTLAGPGQRIEVSNLAETGYVFTQELIELMLELRAGNHPDVVVFYDGLNDVASAMQFGVPGIPQNESKRIAEFAMGRALDRAAYEQGFRKDMRALGVLAGQAAQQFAMTDWAKSRKLGPAANYISVDSATRGAVHVYAENVRMIEALSAKYGFTPIFVWQPNLHASEKQLVPYEQRLRRSIENDPYHSRLQQMHRMLPPVLDSAVAGLAPGRFVDASSLFRGDTMSVYTDWLGHNTEQSVPKIVDAFWVPLQTAVQAAVARNRLSAMAAMPAKNRQRGSN